MGSRAAGGQVLVEALQDLKHRLAVVEKDVAPHNRVGGHDPGEVAKAAGRELDDLGFEAVLESVAVPTIV
jgi:hypothetical protein